MEIHNYKKGCYCNDCLDYLEKICGEIQNPENKTINNNTDKQKFVVRLVETTVKEFQAESYPLLWAVINWENKIVATFAYQSDAESLIKKSLVYSTHFKVVQIKNETN